MNVDNFLHIYLDFYKKKKIHEFIDNNLYAYTWVLLNSHQVNSLLLISAIRWG